MGDGRICTQRNTGCLTVNTALEITLRWAARLDQKIQTVGIGDVKGFIRSFESADFRVGERYIGARDYRTNLAPDLTANFPDAEGKSKCIGRAFHANLLNQN